MDLFFLGIFVLLISGVLSLFVKEEFKLKLLLIFNVIALPLLLSPVYKIWFAENTYSGYKLNFPAPINSVEFYADSLSVFFIIFTSIISLLTTIYANGYLKPYINKNKKIASHCFFLPILTVAMLILVTIQNSLFFLIVWEIMSISSFFLVIFEDDKKEVLNSGIKYLIYMHISVIFIIVAFAIMSAQAGSYDFSTFNAIFINNPALKDFIFILSFIGFGTKAGFVPLHNWLPYAHPAAPSHVSALMSAVMIKTGIYGILRVLTFIETPTVFIVYFIIGISVFTALYGIIYATSQKDIKKLLAYSSVENVGIIGLGIGLYLAGNLYNNSIVQTLGIIGALFHTLNHSIFKSLLFMSAGNLYTKTHTRNIENLGGLIKSMPKTALFSLIGSISICSLPPLNGFIGEFLIFTGLLCLLKVNVPTLFITTILSISSLALVGTLALLCFTKLFSISFLGLPRSSYSSEVKSDTDRFMLIPMGILSILAILIGILSPFILTIIVGGASNFIETNNFTFIMDGIVKLLIQVFICSIILIVLICIIGTFKSILSKSAVKYNTWACGYDKGNNHIQYSASSFVSPFTSILTPLFKKIFDVKKPKGLFPEDAHYSSEVEDVEEAYIINPILRFDEKFLSKFERLQDGNIQHYILYGLIFLIIMLIGVVFTI